jgi:hypothetical protein
MVPSRPGRRVGRSVEGVEIEGAMRTPDGQWRVEIVRRGSTRWYRLVHGDNVVDWLSITGVERLLADAGVDVGALIEDGPDQGVDHQRSVGEAG